MEEMLKRNRICAILRNVPPASVEDYVHAVYEGGIRLFEVAMNSPYAGNQIRLIRKMMEGKPAYVGAGTVVTDEACRIAADSGAQFFLTPSVSIGTLEYCRKNEMPLLPGVMTPTDVAVCLQYGYHILKLFPADAMPLDYIDSLKGPFQNTEYIAVGGVSRKNIVSCFKKGFMGVGIGSSLIPSELLADGDWKKASIAVRELVDLADSV